MSLLALWDYYARPLHPSSFRELVALGLITDWKHTLLTGYPLTTARYIRRSIISLKLDPESLESNILQHLGESGILVGRAKEAADHTIKVCRHKTRKERLKIAHSVYPMFSADDGDVLDLPGALEPYQVFKAENGL